MINFWRLAHIAYDEIVLCEHSPAAHRPTIVTGYTAVWMSEQSEASFFIQDSRRAQQLRSRAVAGRVEKLFSVRVALSARAAAAAAAAGSEQQDGGGEWVALTALNGSNAEKAKVSHVCIYLVVPSLINFTGKLAPKTYHSSSQQGLQFPKKLIIPTTPFTSVFPLSEVYSVAVCA